MRLANMIEIRKSAKIREFAVSHQNGIMKNFGSAAVDSTSSKDNIQFETLSVSVPSEFVYHVQLNRPDKMNAINHTMWMDLKKCFSVLGEDENCRVVVLSGAGKLFCAGIDLHDMIQVGMKLGEKEDIARKCKILKNLITNYQESLTAIEKCPKPVISAIHGGCIGGGVDIIAAADIRYSSSDAWFQIKEVDIGMAADVGTLQRFPRIIGSSSLCNELVFTARKLPAEEGKDCGLVSKVFNSRESLMEASMKLALEISLKSPVAVQGSKQSMLYSRDHTVEEGLNHIALWNQVMLQSDDFASACLAQATKGPTPPFSKL
ncbi:unnamed protein product [Bemisia tabaci]|uniref:Delta(3,5)-Delta(2,4)-dienoyl-CoA isomerase, mitochondrial n=1 Tax=Bemisia tabaci TaxID=7038 RepID=A0A9P0C8N3_BEMTA|nr:unnamed protein product [Bemisia tabaci]